MKIGIFYFTGTGSTLKLAQEIAAGMQESESGSSTDPLKIELFPWKHLAGKDISAFDLIGIGAPVYSFRAPRVVTRVLNHLTVRNKKFFLFLTCGGMEGNAFWNLYRPLNKKGWDLLETILVYGPNNLRSWLPKLSEPAPEYQGLSGSGLIQARAKATELIGSFDSRRPMKIHSHLWWAPYTALFTWPWQMRIMVGKKLIDTDACTKCRLCISTLCTTQSISEGKDGYPVFKEKTCTGCQACVNLCPTLAIYSKSTRDHHPYQVYQKEVLKQ